MTWKNKTLIILIPGFPANEQDSACLPFPQAFVKHLKLSNPDLNIKVLTFQYPYFEAVYEWHACEVHAFNGRNKGGIRRLFLWTTIWRRLKKIFREEKVTGILSFWMGEASLLAKFAAKKYGVRSFTWLMGQDARKNNRYVSIVRSRQESLIALSDFLADEFFRNYKIKPAHTIPPGIDIVSFPEKKIERKIDILGVGSLIPLKQFDQIILLVAALADTHPDIRAVICGDGPERGKLQQLIQHFHLTSQIELRGELDHDSILDIMRESRILVHPSSYEGFGIVFLEALYAGTQVLSYCKPMHINFDHHHIVKTKEEMKEKLLELLNNKNMKHDSVLTWPIGETCNKILSLYN
ncbi:MAG TPA: glycosyltransferase [Puia sp.]|jgi:glycosyltransferase involved in cell wall biosynthesis